MDERVVLWSWCPECGERHSSDHDCVASRRLSAALDAFIAAYGDGCTWREVPGLVAGSRIAALESERDRLRQALERCQRELDRREQALRDTSHQLSLAGAALLDAEAELDRCREALLRVFRDRREPDKVFAQVSTAVGFDALVETGLVRPLVRDGDRSANAETRASDKEVGG